MSIRIRGSTTSDSISCYLNGLDSPAIWLYYIVYLDDVQYCTTFTEPGVDQTPIINIDDLEPDTEYTVKFEVYLEEYYSTLIGEYEKDFTTQSEEVVRKHYACYDVTNDEYIDGYTDYDDNTTRSESVTAPSLSGYDYEGYIYHATYVQCLNQYYEERDYDSTNSTISRWYGCDYVVFFYSNGSGGESSEIELSIGAGEIIPVMVNPSESGTYTFETTGDYDTYGYFSAGNVDTTEQTSAGKLRPTSYHSSDDDSGDSYNFKIVANILQQTYKIWVRFHSVSESGTPTLKITPPLATFYGSMTANGKTAANIWALFENGDETYSKARYIRLKLNGSWTTVGGSNYYPSNESAGATSTFSVSKTGLTVGTTYTYEVHLYYKSGSSYYDTGLYMSGSFTTDQSATGMMLYSNGWKNAVPYIYTNGSWHRASSRLYNNGWKS